MTSQDNEWFRWFSRQIKIADVRVGDHVYMRGVTPKDRIHAIVTQDDEGTLVVRSPTYRQGIDLSVFVAQSHGTLCRAGYGCGDAAMLQLRGVAQRVLRVSGQVAADRAVTSLQNMTAEEANRVDVISWCVSCVAFLPPGALVRVCKDKEAYVFEEYGQLVAFETGYSRDGDGVPLYDWMGKHQFEVIDVSMSQADAEQYYRLLKGIDEDALSSASFMVRRTTQTSFNASSDSSSRLFRSSSSENPLVVVRNLEDPSASVSCVYLALVHPTATRVYRAQLPDGSIFGVKTFSFSSSSQTSSSPSSLTPSPSVLAQELIDRVRLLQDREHPHVISLLGAQRRAATMTTVRATNEVRPAAGSLPTEYSEVPLQPHHQEQQHQQLQSRSSSPSPLLAHSPHSPVVEVEVFMELCNASLEEVILGYRPDPMPSMLARRYAREIVSGLLFLNRADVHCAHAFHLDPHKILVGQDGKVRLTDFSFVDTHQHHRHHHHHRASIILQQKHPDLAPEVFSHELQHIEHGPCIVWSFGRLVMSMLGLSTTSSIDQSVHPEQPHPQHRHSHPTNESGTDQHHHHRYIRAHDGEPVQDGLLLRLLEKCLHKKHTQRATLEQIIGDRWLAPLVGEEDLSTDLLTTTVTGVVLNG